MVLPLQPSDKLTQNPCQILQHTSSTLKFYSWPKVFKSSLEKWTNQSCSSRMCKQTWTLWIFIHGEFSLLAPFIFFQIVCLKWRRGIILPWWVPQLGLWPWMFALASAWCNSHPRTAQLREIYSSHEHTTKQHSWEETTCGHVTVNCWTSDQFVSNKWLQLIYLQDGDHLSNSSQSNCRVGLHLIKTIHAQWTSPQNLHPNEFAEQKSEKD